MTILKYKLRVKNKNKIKIKMSVVDNMMEEHPLLSHDFFEDDSGIDELKEQRRVEMKAAETNPEEYIKQAKLSAAKKKAESLIARIKNRQSSGDVGDEEPAVDDEVQSQLQTSPQSNCLPSSTKMSRDSENIEEVLFNEPQQPDTGSKTIIIHNVKKLIIRF